MDFFDTNVIVYANDGRDARKQGIAIDLVTRGMREGSGTISTQVLQEYAVTAMKKLGQAMSVVIHQLHLLETLRMVAVSPALVRRALEVSAMYQLDYWDSLVLAAAEHEGCDRILSEDLNPGQVYCGVRYENPFAT